HSISLLSSSRNSLSIPFLSIMPFAALAIFFFFNDTATTEIYTLSLHDALPISRHGRAARRRTGAALSAALAADGALRAERRARRSEEHTSELQSLTNLVCRLLLEKKKI